MTPEVINAAKNLKFIGRAGTGVDNINLEAATARGIIVMNTPGGNTNAAAEMTFSLLMSSFRNVPQVLCRNNPPPHVYDGVLMLHAVCVALQGNKSLLDGKWERKAFGGNELKGKTVRLNVYRSSPLLSPAPSPRSHMHTRSWSTVADFAQLGIIGTGNIGQRVAKWAQAFEMDVIGYDPVMSADVRTARGYAACPATR